MTKVAIMQPTFIPWTGYFAMIGSVDKFVFLDDVQLSKQSWQTRNQLRTQNGAKILPLQISRQDKKPLIMNANLSDRGFETKLLKTVRGSLGKAPFFPSVEAILIDAFAHAKGKLSDLNIHIIREICQMVGIELSLIKSSELQNESGDKGDRLFSICEQLGAETYLSPVGAFDYLKADNPFEGTSISLRFFNYEHPEYIQLHDPFMPYMSVVDALANVGPERFRHLAMSGCRDFLEIGDLGG